MTARARFLAYPLVGLAGRERRSTSPSLLAPRASPSLTQPPRSTGDVIEFVEASPAPEDSSGDEDEPPEAYLEDVAAAVHRLQCAPPAFWPSPPEASKPAAPPSPCPSPPLLQLTAPPLAPPASEDSGSTDDLFAEEMLMGTDLPFDGDAPLLDVRGEGERKRARPPLGER